MTGNNPFARASRRVTLGLLAWLLVAGFSVARAGGGPENIFLLVNANSQDSKTVANHYIQLRQIPANNVLYIDWTGDVEHTPVETFRTKILQPALETIAKRGLSNHIDYLVYSSDFPWRVDLAGDFAGIDLPRQLAPYASLTGATYLWKFVAARNHNMLGLRNNLYVQKPDQETHATQSYGFRSWYGWGPGGRRLEAGGTNYLLSTMLAVTSGRGNKIEDVVHYLTRSASADGSRPRGTVYFMKNSDLRSTTRDWAFEGAVQELKQLGVRARVINGKVPQRKEDVAGAVLGVATFSWKSSGSTILPGAICEHLTSTGGVLRKGAGQTPLTQFLSYGAAGASGTVTEPFAIQDKFPLATMHVHYARGCSLAEAFYQSVAGPYQLLIVGDPLCRPWAAIPTVSVAGLNAGEVVNGVVTLTPSAEIAPGFQIEQFELYVDGRRMQRVRPGEVFPLDTRSLDDGYHELSVVATESSVIESQGRLVLPFLIRNAGHTVPLNTSSEKKITSDEKIRITAQSDGATAMVVHQNGHPVGRIYGDQGEVVIEAETLGLGPVRLQAIAAHGSARAISKPLTLTIEAPDEF